MGYKMRVTGDTALHFPGDGFETFTSSIQAAATATITPTGATYTAGGTVPTAGQTGYAYLPSVGFWAPFTAVTAGANGVISVDFWRHVNPALNGSIGSGLVSTNMTLHQSKASSLGGSVVARSQRSIIRSIAAETSVAGTVTITDFKGTAISVITLIGATAQPFFLDYDDETYRFAGPFGIQLSAAGIMVVIGFQAELEAANPLLAMC